MISGLARNILTEVVGNNTYITEEEMQDVAVDYLDLVLNGRRYSVDDFEKYVKERLVPTMEVAVVTMTVVIPLPKTTSRASLVVDEYIKDEMDKITNIIIDWQYQNGGVITSTTIKEIRENFDRGEAFNEKD